jgi:hypothetical protein
VKSTDSIDGAIRQGEPPYRPAAEGQEASAKRPWLTRRRLIITTLSLPLLAIAWWFSAYPRETRDGPRGWYYAGSNLKDDEALGGFGPCDNFPKKCAKDGPGKVGDISLVAFPDEIVDFRNRKTLW